MSELLNYLLNNEPQFRKARLAALYSDFLHLQTTNPDGYSANTLAWHNGLSHAALAGCIPSPSAASREHLTFSISQNLLGELETKEWGRPLSLGAVVNDAIAEKKWIPYNEFMNREESIYARSWRIRVPRPWEVVGWGLRLLGVLGPPGMEEGKVVVVSNLEAVGKDVMATYAAGPKGRIERIFSRTEFADRFGQVLGEGKILSPGDLDLLLRFLERDKGVLVYDSETVKFKAPNEKASSITVEDTTIANLKALIKDLGIQINGLEKKVDELARVAKEAVAKGNRVSALAALRSKKIAETTLGKRHATLAQLEEVYMSIEQAADQVDLVRVMEASTRVLTKLNKEVGGVERVDDAVENLREQMGLVSEVGDVIAEAGQSGANDLEVDDELEAMEREEREKREAVEKKEREEREKREVEETRRKLEVLEKSEKEARAEAESRLDAEKKVDESTQELKRLSLEPATAS